MAIIMGATIKDSLDSSVTDYITDLENGKKQLEFLSYKGKRCVSPLWIITCYEQKKRLPSVNFPLNLHTHINTLPAVGSFGHLTPLNDDDDPFGLEEIDYDYLEASKSVT